MNAHIIGWGKYLPSKIVSNEELAQTAKIDPEWIKTRTGIEARHIVGLNQATSDLAIRAAHAALEVADLAPNRLDLIIVGSGTHDHLFPSTASLVQDALGADHAAAFDISAGCSGFLYGLATADRFIRSGAYRNILVIGADAPSRILDYWHDPIAAYFGDGAGAVVLTASEQSGGMLAFKLGSDGSGADLLILKAGGTRLPLSQEVLDQQAHYGTMNGRGVFRFGVRATISAAHNVLRSAKLTVADIDLFIPHQTNSTLIHQVAERLRVPREKTIIGMKNYANISTAAIPVALCDAIEARRIQPGQRVLMTTFGAGMTYAGMIWQWPQVMPQKQMSFVRRFGHAVWDAQAAFKSRLFHFEHHLDTLTPTEEEMDAMPAKEESVDKP